MSILKKKIKKKIGNKRIIANRTTLNLNDYKRII